MWMTLHRAVMQDCNLYTCEGLCGKEMAQSSDQLRRMLKDGRVPSNSVSVQTLFLSLPCP